MKQIYDYLDMAFKFHGHRCPAVLMGLRAGLAAMEALGVDRAKDKELRVISETGKGHAAACIVDGIMIATGCTYGKSNIEKLYYNKMAFTLMDVNTGRAIRVSLKPEFFEEALRSPCAEKRKAGVLPQDMPPEIIEPHIEKILTMAEAEFLNISGVFEKEVEKITPNFEAQRCSKCGELVFTDKIQKTSDGRGLCIPCAESMS
ncbi:MAG: formylmethanofuran dehydrogenase [Nitrospirae bacterium]|nr:MAG: formylmethanofuran dehydrogenase [Nitrospirota bacterium]